MTQPNEPANGSKFDQNIIFLSEMIQLVLDDPVSISGIEKKNCMFYKSKKQFFLERFVINNGSKTKENIPKEAS